MHRFLSVPSTSSTPGSGGPVLPCFQRLHGQSRLRCFLVPAAISQSGSQGGQHTQAGFKAPEPAGIFIPVPSPGQIFLAAITAVGVGSVVDNPARRAVRKALGIGGENKTLGSWDELSKVDVNEDLTKEYKEALARTRQAIAVQRAAEFNRSRQTGRAVAELQKALQEHAVCRSPILSGAVENVDELYQLALRNISPQVPPDYGTILELRSMFGISPNKAESLERLALEQPGSFSI